jgi:uncharacterized membrane protein YiaA
MPFQVFTLGEFKLDGLLLLGLFVSEVLELVGRWNALVILADLPFYFGILFMTTLTALGITNDDFRSEFFNQLLSSQFLDFGLSLSLLVPGSSVEMWAG